MAASPDFPARAEPEPESVDPRHHRRPTAHSTAVPGLGLTSIEAAGVVSWVDDIKARREGAEQLLSFTDALARALAALDELR